jgi:predicted RNase H-like nuclease
MEVVVDRAWVGIDVGKEFHWVHVLDTSGKELLSRKLENDEIEISKLLDKVLSVAEEVLWAVDQPGGSALHSCWRWCGNETRGSFKSPVSP